MAADVTTGLFPPSGLLAQGAMRGVFAPAIIRPTYYPWRFGCEGDSDAVGNGTDDTEGLQRFLDAVTSGGIGDFGGRNYVFNGRLFVRNNAVLMGYGSALTASPTAPLNCSILCFTDPTEGTAVGPVNVVCQGLTINGNATARRAAGSLSGVGSAANFYCISANNLTIRDCISNDAEGDCFYVGGDSTQGGTTTFFKFDNCYATIPGRNGYSAVGAVVGKFDSCVINGATFGAAHSNISSGFDFEPNGSTSQNAAVNCTDCAAAGCTTEGFGVHNTQSLTVNVNWTNCYTQSCGIGYAAGATSSNVRVVGARYSGNTTNFSNLAEAIASFP